MKFPGPLRAWGAEALAVALALILRVGLLHTIAGGPLFEPVEGGHDRSLYHAAAQRVASGDLWPDGAFDHLPLYPWALGAVYAVTGPDLRAAAAFGIACDLLTVFLLVRLSRRLDATPALGALAGALYAAYPLAITYSALTMPTSLNVLLVTTFVFLVATRAAWTARSAAGLGLLVGIGALGFAGLLVMGLALAAWWGVHRDGAPRAAALLAYAMAAALPLLPVATHNSRAEGRFVLLTTHGGFNLYLGNHARATGYPVKVRDFRMTARAMLDDAHAEAEREAGRPLRRSESSAWWAGQARGFWREQPGRAAGLLVRKAFLFFNRNDVDDLRMVEQLRLAQRQFRSPCWPGFLAIGTLGLLGLWRTRGAARVVLLAGMASVVALFITARYRLVFAPALLALGAAALPGWWTDLRGTRRLRAAFVAALALLIPAWPAGPRGPQAEDYYNVSVQWLAAGRADAALAAARDGRAFAARDANLWHAEGSALYRLERYGEAAAAFRQSWELNPSHPQAAYNAALSLARAGDLCGARDALRQAASLRPLHEQARALLRELESTCP